MKEELEKMAKELSDYIANADESLIYIEKSIGTEFLNVKLAMPNGNVFSFSIHAKKYLFCHSFNDLFRDKIFIDDTTIDRYNAIYNRRRAELIKKRQAELEEERAKLEEELANINK